MNRPAPNGTKSRPHWKEILSESVTNPEELPSDLKRTESGLHAVASRYPMRINPYYLRLIQQEGDPIYRQCIPDPRELEDSGLEDPLNEEGASPVSGLTHRYPDRVLFLVSGECAVYCRFCNRKRKVGVSGVVTNEGIHEGLDYIRTQKQVRDVLLSGGDPLLLEDEELFDILEKLRAVPHVEIIRIGTRVPCTLPQRITAELAKGLARFHPLYVHTHFNHPREITFEAACACAELADAGIPIGCQTVLLKGVNDDPETIKSLMQRLVAIRVRPYYLFQADLARGTSHFWTPLKRGIEIIGSLHGHTSGLCVPRFAVDLPGGGGKVPILPDYTVDKRAGTLRLKNYKGETFDYPLIQGRTRPMS